MAHRTTWLAVSLASALSVVGSASAQSYRDLTLVRNREQPYRSLLQFRGGWTGVEAEGDTVEDGHAAQDTLAGFVYYHSKDVTRARDWALDMYAGTDGLYAGLKGDLFRGQKTQNRLEVYGRPRAFYREGYIQGDKNVVTGQYEGQDFGLRIGNAQVVEKGLVLDLSAFYRRFGFKTTDDPATRIDYVIPDDYSAFGGAVTLEQNTVELDRRLGLPRQGVLWTITAEYERNTSKRVFGFSSGYTSELPTGVYRGETHLEIYAPNGDSGVWEIQVDGGLYDSADRVIAYRANRVQGHIWGDGTLGYRMVFGSSFLLKPLLEVQYSRTLDLTGVSNKQKVYWGGGLSMSWIFSANLALVMDYSYVNNPSRGYVGIEHDYYGEHQFFVGMDVLFGSGGGR